MKKSWFLHEQLSESQALELAERYRKKNYLVEKSLSSDFTSWGIRVLPEFRQQHTILPPGKFVCCCRNSGSPRGLTEPTHKKCGWTDARITKCRCCPASGDCAP